jgi:DNA-binding response OmpR family regulator
MIHVLVVEDDKNLRRLMTVVLKQNDYQVSTASNGEEALDILGHSHIDIVISDIMMPNMDGYEFTAALRKDYPYLPVLMATAKEHIEDKRKGFMVGTDDYMVKPLDMDELILRISALLRRSRIAIEHRLTIGETIIDAQSLTITHKDESLVLPKKEFLILFKLLSYPNKIFTRQQLMDEIWGMDTETDERTVDVHIKRLRNRISENLDFEILTVRGLGYKGEISNEAH